VSASSILVIGLGGVLLLPIVWRIALHRFDPFEPIVLFSLAWGAMFVVRPAVMLVNGDLTYFRLDISATLPRALLLALIGSVVFVGAYELRTGHALVGRLPRPRQIELGLGLASAIVMIVLAFVALIAFFKGFSDFDLLLGGRSERLGRILHDSSTYLWYGSTLVIPAALLSLALALRNRRPIVALVGAAAAGLAFFRMVPSGSRIFLLPLLGGAFVYLYVRRDRRPAVPMLFVVCVGAVVASYALLLYRYPDTRSGVGSGVQSLLEHPDRAFGPILHGADAEMAPALAGALRVVPHKLHYRYGGAVLGDLVVRPIPRQLWKGKPEPPSQEVVAAAWPRAARYSFDPSFSPLLFFYWDFWIVGVIVGMAIFGIAARMLYEWFLRFRHDLAAQLVFAVGVWFVVIGARNDPVDTIVLATFLVLPLAIVNWLAGLRMPLLASFLERSTSSSDETLQMGKSLE
jgi:hypothetical protein